MTLHVHEDDGVTRALRAATTALERSALRLLDTLSGVRSITSVLGVVLSCYFGRKLVAEMVLHLRT